MPIFLHQLPRRSPVADSSLRKKNDIIAQLFNFHHIMRSVHNSDLLFALQFQEQFPHPVSNIRVKRGSRLVKQQEPWLIQERFRQIQARELSC